LSSIPTADKEDSELNEFATHGCHDCKWYDARAFRCLSFPDEDCWGPKEDTEICENTDSMTKNATEDTP